MTQLDPLKVSCLVGVQGAHLSCSDQRHELYTCAEDELVQWRQAHHGHQLCREAKRTKAGGLDFSTLYQR